MTLPQAKLLSSAALLLVAVFGSRCVAGVIAYNNFGSDDTYDVSGSWQGSGGDSASMLAQRFTAEASGALSKIELGIFFTPPIDELHEFNIDELTLAIVLDVNGKPGTQELWSQFYSGNVSSIYDFGEITTFNVVGGPFIQTGSQYWLTSRSTSVGFRPHSWYSTFENIEPAATFNFYGGPPEEEGIWVVSASPTGPVPEERSLRVTVIPEPAAAALMLAASATLLTVRRRTSL